MSNKKEVVVCAATKTYDPATRETEVKIWIRYPYYGDFDREYDAKELYDRGIIKGFVTSRERFVTPEEALLITGRQREMRFQNRKYLLPEDLY